MDRHKILLLGTDETYDHWINAIVKAQLVAAGRTVVGEVYMAGGETDFSQIMAQLQAAPPDAIFTTLHGAGSIAFFRAFSEAGFTAATLPVLSVGLTEDVIQAVGAATLVGHFTAAPYYQTLQTAENFTFVTAFKNIYGEERVTSYPVESSYNAVYLWQLLTERAQATTVTALRRAAANNIIEFTAPNGVIRLDRESQYLYMSAYLGRIRDDGLIEPIFQSEAPLAPDPNLSRYPWAAPVRTTITQEQAAASEAP